MTNLVSKVHIFSYVYDIAVYVHNCFLKQNFQITNKCEIQIEVNQHIPIAENLVLKREQRAPPCGDTALVTVII